MHQIPFWEGSWNTEIYNMDGKLQYKPRRDGDTFEVNDASNDDRIPQHVVKEYNIQA